MLSRIPVITRWAFGIAAVGLILFLVIGDVGLLLSLVSPILVEVLLAFLHRRRSPAAAEDLTAWATKRIKHHWDEEARRRGMDLEIMPSRWRRAPGSEWAEENLAVEGNLNDLITAYVRHPFQLVLLGERGSGKTTFCVRLLRELAASTNHVPVLFSLSSWNRDQPFDDWMTEQLHTTYGLRRDTARQVLGSGRLLPILDGFDEGSGRNVADSLRKINMSRAGRGPMVLTCLDSAFDAPRVDHLLARDAEIHILPLEPYEIAQVLIKHSRGRQSWADVIAEVRTNEHGPLAEALNTRLMLFLAINVLSKTPDSPGRLVSDGRLRTAGDIRYLIIGLFLDTALHGAPVHAFRDPRRTRRWLMFIADHLYSSDMRLSWWRFSEYYRYTPLFPVVRVLVGAAVTAGLCWLLFGLFGHPAIGLIFGGMLGVVGGIVMSVLRTADPRALPKMLRTPEGLAPAVLSAVLSGSGGTIAIGFLYRDPVVGVLSGVALGLGFGVVRRMLTAEQPAALPSLDPDRVLHDDRRIVVQGFLYGALVAGVVGGALGLLRRVEQLGIVIDVPTLAAEVIVMAGVGAICGAFTLAMMLHATSAWGWLTITRAKLAVRDDVPWRLMTFLREAADAGIFRRLGPQYEFRNELFRTYLLLAREDDEGEEEMVRPGGDLATFHPTKHHPSS